MNTVLVTGGTGFIASHTILQLLAAGHRVRTTLRNLSREGEVRAMLRNGGAEPGDQLSFVAAELMSDAGWPAAVSGCEYVLHVASPFPSQVPKDENDCVFQSGWTFPCRSRYARSAAPPIKAKPPTYIPIPSIAQSISKTGSL